MKKLFFSIVMGVLILGFIFMEGTGLLESSQKKSQIIKTGTSEIKAFNPSFIDKIPIVENEIVELEEIEKIKTVPIQTMEYKKNQKEFKFTVNNKNKEFQVILPEETAQRDLDIYKKVLEEKRYLVDLLLEATKKDPELFDMTKKDLNQIPDLESYLDTFGPHKELMREMITEINQRAAPDE